MGSLAYEKHIAVQKKLYDFPTKHLMQGNIFYSFFKHDFYCSFLQKRLLSEKSIH